MHQHVSTGWARKLMDYGKMGHGAGWQPGTNAEVEWGGRGSGRARVGRGGGAAVQIHSHCFTLVVLIVVSGVLLSLLLPRSNK